MLPPPSYEVKLEAHGCQVDGLLSLLVLGVLQVVQHVRADLDAVLAAVRGEGHRVLQRVPVYLFVGASLEEVHEQALYLFELVVVLERVALEHQHRLALEHRLLRVDVGERDEGLHLELEEVHRLVVEQTAEDHVVGALLRVGNVHEERAVRLLGQVLNLLLVVHRVLDRRVQTLAQRSLELREVTHKILRHLRRTNRATQHGFLVILY